MTQLKIEKVEETLAQEGFTSDQTQKVKDAIIANLPAKTYNTAVLFLGSATIVLILGGILLAYIGRTVPEALWSVLGAGFGGLAGIFMGKK